MVDPEGQVILYVILCFGSPIEFIARGKPQVEAGGNVTGV